VADARGIDFLRSTTTTRADRTASGEVSISVEHTARFAIEPGTLPDMTHQYGSQTFRPQFVTVEWHDGKLRRIAVRGQRVLKSGKVQDNGDPASRNFDWTGADVERGRGYKDTPIPEALLARIKTYETEVAITAAEAH
ncbi:MAG: hypothetical protein JO214_00565, partial [Frankiaceae bacterium]|nr:hypothetical protein [Frankiaceae bacterium]